MLRKNTKKYNYTLWWAGALLCAGLTACTADSTIQEEDVVDNQTPMAFGTSLSTSESAVTRAATSLAAGFKVGTWKKFKQEGEQLVMDGYQVNYNSAATTYRWYYEGVNNQVLRYWDLSAYPYEFRAVSPYFDGATITTSGLDLDLTGHRPFKAQIYINGTYNVSNDESEPCVVAQVCRKQNGSYFEDYDEIKSTEINTDGKTNAVREVQMPFHHLITKVGFRIFIDDPQPSSPTYKVTLKSIKISVVNTDNQFITASNRYTATNAQGLGSGTFAENTRATGEFTLLQHGEYTDENLREHLNRATAFDLCENYMQQIPQKDVQIRVHVEMLTYNEVNGTMVHTKNITYDRVLSLDKTSVTGDKFTWEPDTRYIYYLHIPNLIEDDIYLDTCEVLSWDEVQTSDITIEL